MMLKSGGSGPPKALQQAIAWSLEQTRGEMEESVTPDEQRQHPLRTR